MRGVGYFISIFSVLMLGAVAWPKSDEPGWKLLALVAGMTSSIAGMLLRWVSSRKQQHELRSVEQRGEAR